MEASYSGRCIGGSPELFAPHLESTRCVYSNLRRRYLVAPDGNWAADCSSGDDSGSPAGSSSRSGEGASGWDPLSLDGDSPWKTWFAHAELRATIRQDVDRTFPDIAYFRLERVKRIMTSVLFLWAVQNPDVGYRQGMHELFAVCLLVIDRDSLDPATAVHAGADAAMASTLDRHHIEHDAFELYQALMKSAKPFYEWRAEEGPRSSTSTAPPAPIITRCRNLQSSLIRHVDPQLWERLDTEGVEAQLWAIRWIRLLFTREIPFGIALRLWDGIFAADPSLGLLDYICVAMLLLIRNELIEADYGTLLTSLLRYPAPSEAYPFEPHLILSQALYLRDNTNPTAGVQVVLQNQDILGVQAQPPGPSADIATPPSQLSGLPGRNTVPPNRSRAGTPQGSGVQGLAQGLFARAQAAGLDRAIFSTVADLRKNLPDSATAYSYLPNLPFSPNGQPGSGRDGGFSSIPSSASAVPQRSFFSTPPPSAVPSTAPAFRPGMGQRRPSIESTVSIKSMKDAEREMAELRLAMMGMGKAMNGWLLAIAQPDYSELEKQMATRGLERLRDTLLDAAGRDVDDIIKEWAWHEGLEAPRSRAETPVPEPQPSENPVASSESPPPDIPANVIPLSNTARSPDPAAAEVLTPTAPSFDTFPTTPRASRFPSMASPVPKPRLPPHPQVHKSPQPAPQAASQPPSQPASAVRSGQPSAGLTRTPMMPGTMFAPADPWSANTPRSPINQFALSDPPRRSSAIKVEQGSPTTATGAGGGDPLAGLGVSVAAPSAHHRGGHGAASRTESLDPLRR